MYNLFLSLGNLTLHTTEENTFWFERENLFFLKLQIYEKHLRKISFLMKLLSWLLKDVLQKIYVLQKVVLQYQFCEFSSNFWKIPTQEFEVIDLYYRNLLFEIPEIPCWNCNTERLQSNIENFPFLKYTKHKRKVRISKTRFVFLIVLKIDYDELSEC